MNNNSILDLSNSKSPSLYMSYCLHGSFFQNILEKTKAQINLAS